MTRTKGTGTATVLFLLGFGLLAGCAAPDEKEDDPLIGLCPQWAQGPGSTVQTLVMDAGQPNVQAAFNASLVHQGLSLDLYRLEVDHEGDGQVAIWAEAQDGRRLTLRDHRLSGPQIVPLAKVGGQAPGDGLFEVFLTHITRDAQPEPGPIMVFARLEEGASATVTLVVTYHYRVCGHDF